ncbi:MAG: hypothetical protein PHG48_08730 [Eubacteriales bacterium]|nr:hypothetical protein [Eubacteriales bacterium]
MASAFEAKKIESRFDVRTYIDRLKYLLQKGDNNVRIIFQRDRKIDDTRNIKHTNRYTIMALFPNEDEVEALKRELLTIDVDDYIETVRDKRYPDRSEMRVFGKKYIEKDVYIKIRVELLSNIASSAGYDYLYVMSFHFAEESFVKTNFPYRQEQINENIEK